MEEGEIRTSKRGIVTFNETFVDIGHIENIEVDVYSDENEESGTNSLCSVNFSDKRVEGIINGYKSKRSGPVNGSPPALCDLPCEANVKQLRTQQNFHNETGCIDRQITPPTSKFIMFYGILCDFSLNNSLLGSLNGDQQEVEPTPDLFLVVPNGYPDVVINDNHKRTILNYLNDAIKARALRPGQDEITIDKVMHRSGVLVIRTNNVLSTEWIRFMIADHHWNDLSFGLTVSYEAGFEFAPAYTAWIPDDSSSFEYFMRKARHNRINTNTWRFVRIITEKGKPGVMGKKFTFVAILTCISREPSSKLLGRKTSVWQK